ncbi:MAG: ketoacyl-ACP synthase III [Oscillospiraceae bacterium]|nr:ketoacyl-ACP synthase III [Oscillospiraceae bacterium]
MEEKVLYGINIIGTGSYTPQKRVVNDDYKAFIETSDEWIRTRTGMVERYVSDGEPTWYMGSMAAKQAIEAAGIDVLDIGIIIDATITSDYYTPSMACMVQRELGAENAMALDINCACSGFVYGVDMAKRYLQTDEHIKYALVVANENLTKITDYTDRASCVLFADGAAAVVIEAAPDKLYTSYCGSDGNGGRFLFARSIPPANAFLTGAGHVDDGYPESNSHYLYQDGKEVYKFATHALPMAMERAAERIGFDLNELDAVVPHQANIRIIETAAKISGLPMDKIVINIDKHANTSSATIPIAFDEAVRSGRIKKGDKVCFVGFGAGLTFGAIIFEY